MGALNILSQEWAYYPWGALTPAEAAEKWNDIINQAYADSLVPGACDIVPAPFWDDTSGDDAPDEAPANDQHWYGVWDGDTFLETVSYTLLTGFLATLVGTQAAIKFLTIPRAFRVLIRQNPHGANLLLFLDGGLYKVINGYSPFDRVAEFLIASPGTELLLVVDSTHDPDSTPNAHGDYVVDVIRTRLDEADVTNTSVRYYDTPPVFQTTYDGGTTWVDTPDADVRYSPYAQFPHLTPYAGVGCDTAARMTAQLKASIELMCSVGDAAQAVTGLLELILLPTGLVGTLLSLFFTICDWIIDNGQATILAAFTTAVYDDIRCHLYCHIEADGSITQVNLDAAWEEIKAAHTGTVATVIDEVRFLFTDNIFTNAGVKRTETGDCTGCECDWCYEWDFTGTDGGWTAQVISGLNFAVYSPGNGWGARIQTDGCSSHGYWYMEKALGGSFTSLTAIDVEYVTAIGAFDGATMYQLSSGTVVATHTFPSGVSTIHSATLSSPSTDQLRINLNKCGTLQIYEVKIRIHGHGPMPAFSGGSAC